MSKRDRSVDNVIAGFERLLEQEATRESHVQKRSSRSQLVRLARGQIEPSDYVQAIEFSAHRALCAERADAERKTGQSVPRGIHSEEFRQLVDDIDFESGYRKGSRRRFLSYDLLANIEVLQHTLLVCALIFGGLILLGASLTVGGIGWSLDYTSVWLGAFGALVSTMIFYGLSVHRSAPAPAESRPQPWDAEAEQTTGTGLITR